MNGSYSVLPVEVSPPIFSQDTSLSLDAKIQRLLKLRQQNAQYQELLKAYQQELDQTHALEASTFQTLEPEITSLGSHPTKASPHPPDALEQVERTNLYSSPPAISDKNTLIVLGQEYGLETIGNVVFAIDPQGYYWLPLRIIVCAVTGIITDVGLSGRLSKILPAANFIGRSIKASRKDHNCVRYQLTPELCLLIFKSVQAYLSAKPLRVSETSLRAAEALNGPDLYRAIYTNFLQIGLSVETLRHPDQPVALLEPFSEARAIDLPLISKPVDLTSEGLILEPLTLEHPPAERLHPKSTYQSAITFIVREQGRKSQEPYETLYSRLYDQFDYKYSRRPRKNADLGDKSVLDAYTRLGLIANLYHIAIALYEKPQGIEESDFTDYQP